MPDKYKRIKHPKYTVKHRLIMAKHIGRDLTEIEVVHHINGDRYDNRIENLQLLKGRKEHNQIHAGTHCPHGHKFTQENTSIKKQHSNGNPTRRCKECARIYTRKYTKEVINKNYTPE